MKQTRAISTREADERVLAMLAMRDRGLTSTEIGEALGMEPGVVSEALSRVNRDLALSEAQP